MSFFQAGKLTRLTSCARHLLWQLGFAVTHGLMHPAGSPLFRIHGLRLHLRTALAPPLQLRQSHCSRRPLHCCMSTSSDAARQQSASLAHDTAGDVPAPVQHAAGTSTRNSIAMLPGSEGSDAPAPACAQRRHLLWDGVGWSPQQMKRFMDHGRRWDVSRTSKLNCSPLQYLSALGG